MGYVDNEERDALYALLVHELSPQNYFYAGLMFNPETGPNVQYWESNNKEIIETINLILSYLEGAKLGIEKTSDRIKLGHGKERELVKIKEIIRVCKKTKITNVKPTIGHSIDWSHRWEVMGHWRKTKSIGKSREGKYEIRGFTWVVPHEKGPENKLFIKKTRVITSQRN